MSSDYNFYEKKAWVALCREYEREKFEDKQNVNEMRDKYWKMFNKAQKLEEELKKYREEKLEE